VEQVVLAALEVLVAPVVVGAPVVQVVRLEFNPAVVAVVAEVEYLVQKAIFLLVEVMVVMAIALQGVARLRVLLVAR